ncbi:matrixin family metalloprotease [Hyphococcus sp.]|uniref:matrixin family metalloprotease n=1 Tax=Hyphococcus sp. TaxID=2038636 RepID=UPI00208972CC|nr:MAG: hypothetical protein DHS20C04_19220 [Marinicaulis sp.]
MKRKFISSVALSAAAIALSSTAMAGGQLDETKLIGPSAEFPGSIDAILVPIAWPANCSTIRYKLDNIPATTIDIPNAAFAPIPLTAMADEIEATFEEWNKIPTSYIRMELTEIVALNNGTRSFDFINELTWETPPGAGFLASSPSTSLIEDATFVPGDDIDGDGDSDVFDPNSADPALKNQCHDADGDGDIEFVPGDYPAGTILDNDVQFNDPLWNLVSFYWETEPSSDVPFGFTGSDIQAVAVHEFGHSHGLSHSLVNQISDADGTGSTMFPFIDIGDAASEEGQRTLHDDDIAWSSYVYPEGSASSGPAALQYGDRKFEWDYDVLHGTVKTGDGVNILGGNVFAMDEKTGRIVGEGYSGVAKIALTPDLQFFDIVSPEVNALSGAFVIPVKKDKYRVMLQATDGDPAAGGNISFTAFIGEIFGQLTFGEEGYDRPKEGAFESDTGGTSPVVSYAWNPSIDLVTNTEDVLRNGSPVVGFIGTGAAIGASDVIYAERFDGANVKAKLDAGQFITSGLFWTYVGDASAIPEFEYAGIFVGEVDGGGNAVINLNKPIYIVEDFIGQDQDLAPMYIKSERVLANKLGKELRRNPDADVFLVLAAKNGYITGPSGFPPLLALDNDGVVSGTSYLSTFGGPFIQRAGGTDWIVEMRMTD